MILSMLLNLLSISTILLSVVMKAPQIIQIYKQKQTKGISLSSLLLDLINLSTTACYNYVNGYSPMSYMEYPIILLQQYILIGIVLFYNKRFDVITFLSTIIYIGLYTLFLKGTLPTTVLTVLIVCIMLSAVALKLYFELLIFLMLKSQFQKFTHHQPLGTPISLSSKMLQLKAIMKLKNSDNISLTTWSISAYTNAARIFTIFMDSADKMLLTNFCLNTMLSTSILIASVYYKKPKNKI